MVSEKIKIEQEDSQELDIAVDPGKKRYGRLVRMFREGYLAIYVYKNVHEYHVFYDIVILRKIKKNGVQEYVRGANLKPTDLSVLNTLLVATQEYIKSVC